MHLCIYAIWAAALGIFLLFGPQSSQIAEDLVDLLHSVEEEQTGSPSESWCDL